MLLLWGMLTLLLAHMATASEVVPTGVETPKLLAVGVMVVALLATWLRGRRSPAPVRLLWWLLSLAVLMQVMWSSSNLLIATYGDKGDLLQKVGLVFSGLYMIPCMFLIARSFNRNEPRMVIWLDLGLSVLVALLLSRLVFRVMADVAGPEPSAILLIIHNVDAINVLLAAMASLRMLGSASSPRRHFYLAASGFLWINALVAAIYNRIELHGLPWWSGVLIDIPYVVLALATVLEAPPWLQRYRPSRFFAQVLGSFAPIVLSLGILLLGVSVSRVSYATGVAGAIISVVFYGLRVAVIQSRTLDLQRTTSLSNRKLQQQLGTDSLTGIPNRAALDARLRRELLDSPKDGAGCSLLMIDIDYFKLFNDSQGHVAGDRCLIEVARSLSASLSRSSDLVARYGGEEFAVVLSDTPATVASEVARRLVDAVDTLRIPHPASSRGWVTVSVGVAAHTSAATTDIVPLIEEADRALYRAKKNGKNRHEVAVASLAAQSGMS
ncbi:MAG: GGDEF domain-containing protein [Rhodanobacter sp.]|nr:MAG: GGDEF domain-containing protein [Rhodanobacter sp.]